MAGDLRYVNRELRCSAMITLSYCDMNHAHPTPSRFKRLHRRGEDQLAYYHEFFLRGRPDLHHVMEPHKVPGRR